MKMTVDATGNKKLLGAPGLTTRSKDATSIVFFCKTSGAHGFQTSGFVDTGASCIWWPRLS